MTTVIDDVVESASGIEKDEDVRDALERDPVWATHRWPTNGHLLADIARLGYIQPSDLVLDPTYGMGVWWSKWRPERLIAHDIVPHKAPHGVVDFRQLPYADDTFDVVAFDPPYKLNGRPSPEDERYGVDVPATVAERMKLIIDGMTEAARVVNGRGKMLVKCQDQVVSGAIYWQTDEITAHARELGFGKLDRFDLLGSYRPQPTGRAQQHAYGRTSTLLVFSRIKTRGNR